MGDAENASAIGAERASPRQGSGRVRLAHKTIYALRDILASSKAARGDMASILRWIDRERVEAKGRFEAERLARLGELAQLIAELALEVGAIERLAGDARVGEYFESEKKDETEKK